MPRMPRTLPTEGLFHIIGRSNNGITLFKKNADFVRFKSTLKRYLHEYEVFYLHHYSVMQTHYHLQMWVKDTNQLASFVKAMNISYHHYFRKEYDYRGHLWHSRYRSILIDDESQMMQCARYIELNPVHAGICNDPKDYKWTSYHHYAFGKKDELINRYFNDGTSKIYGLNTLNHEYIRFTLAGIDVDYQLLKKQFETERFEQIQGQFSKGGV